LVDISVTAHSGTISAALRAIGHRTFSVQTGGKSLLFHSVSIVGLEG
jgi:hypothetical protein